jgi:hypothetical protein
VQKWRKKKLDKVKSADDYLKELRGGKPFQWKGGIGECHLLSLDWYSIGFFQPAFHHVFDAHLQGVTSPQSIALIGDLEFSPLQSRRII